MNIRVKLICLSFLLFFIMELSPINLWAQKEDLRNLIARAEQLLTENDNERSKEYYYVARDLAFKEKDWAAIVKVGYGFSALDDQGEAKRSWTIGRGIALKQESWEGLYKVGQGFVGIGDIEEALETIRLTRDIAIKHEDWEGLLRVSQIYGDMDNFDETYKVLRLARDIARKQNSWEGLYRVGQGYEFINNRKEANILYNEAEKAARNQGKNAITELGKQIRYFTDTLLIQTITRLKPGIAEGWEVSESGKNITILLRQNIKCFNGRDFKGDSVVTAFENNKDKWNSLGILHIERVNDYKVLLRLRHSFCIPNLSDLETSIRCP